MDKCSSCGLEKIICKDCSGELYKKFGYFIDKTEVIYSFLIAVGFATSAHIIISNGSPIMLLLINAFILMRFFFAPACNLKEAALILEKNPKWQWITFVFDFTLLITHSYLYYQMSYNINDEFKFYKLFSWLLFWNIIWLLSIALRMFYTGKKVPENFKIWIKNNLFHWVIFIVIFFLYSKSFLVNINCIFYLCLFFVFTNCFVDFIFTAPDYLGFRKLGNN